MAATRCSAAMQEKLLGASAVARNRALSLLPYACCCCCCRCCCCCWYCSKYFEPDLGPPGAAAGESAAGLLLPLLPGRCCGRGSLLSRLATDTGAAAGASAAVGLLLTAGAAWSSRHSKAKSSCECLMRHVQLMRQADCLVVAPRNVCKKRIRANARRVCYKTNTLSYHALC
jgi:hypothetical protein